MLLSFLVSCHKKFGVIKSINGFLANKSRFSHGLIAQIVIGVLAVSLGLLFLGALHIARVRALLLLVLVVVLVPTLLGFHNTSVGVATGLLGGMVGFLCYALSFKGINYYLDNLWLGLPLNLAGYLGGWMSGAIVLGQEKCEKACFILTLKTKNLQIITEKIPQLVRDAVTEAYSLVNLKRPKVNENVSGYVLNPSPPRKMGALRFVDKISFDSPRYRTMEELRNTFQRKTEYHTPSQLMSAYWNWFGSYKTIATIESVEEERSNLRIGVISFWESSSLVCCAPYEKVLSLAEKIHNNLIDRMTKMKYEARSLTKGVTVMRSLDTIRKSHSFRVECCGRKLMYRGVISPEVIKNLPQIEMYAFAQTTWDRIRNSKFLKWSVLLLNMIFSYAYSEIVKLLSAVVA